MHCSVIPPGHAVYCAVGICDIIGEDVGVPASVVTASATGSLSEVQFQPLPSGCIFAQCSAAQPPPGPPRIWIHAQFRGVLAFWTLAFSVGSVAWMRNENEFVYPLDTCQEAAVDDILDDISNDSMLNRLCPKWHWKILNSSDVEHEDFEEFAASVPGKQRSASCDMQWPFADLANRANGTDTRGHTACGVDWRSALRVQ